MKAVVTGGAGFIGSHCTERLLKDGHDVTVIDNLSTGRRNNPKPRQGSKPRRVVQADINDPAIAPSFEGVDWVFHFAALADVVPSIDRPMDYFRSNVAGTLSVFEMSRRAGVRRFLYTASSSCYGMADMFPTPERAPIRPQYPYALTKNLGEQCAFHWGQVYHLPVVSLRLFNVYGPRARPSRTYGAVFGVFLAQKLKGRPFTVVGDGTQTRDFTYVTDVVDAFLRASPSSVSGEAFNVGSVDTYAVNRLAQLPGGPAG